MKNLIFNLILCGALVALAAACGSDNAETGGQNATSAQPRTAAATTEAEQVQSAASESGEDGETPFEAGPVGGRLVCNGRVVLPAGARAAVSAPAAGFVRQVYAAPGQYVNAGAPLALLAHPDYAAAQQTYLELRAERDYQTAEAARQRKLADQNAAARKQLEQAEKTLAQLEARLAAQAGRLRFLGFDPAKTAPGNISETLTLRAPAAGVVTEVRAARGELAAPETPLFRLADPGRALVALRVYAKDLARFAPGTRAQVVSDAASGDTLAATVVRVDYKAEASGNLVEVYLRPERRPAWLKEGLFVRGLAR